MDENLTNEYNVLRAEVVALGGNLTKVHDKYTAQLEILKKLQGGIGGNVIDDSSLATTLTWSSSKINTLINSAGLQVEIVEVLPATGETKKIYLVPSSSSETGNVYDEYMWINNTWERIGSTGVDLSLYAQKSWVEAKGYALDASLADYTTKSEFEEFELETNTALQGKQSTISDLATIRSGAAAGATALQSVPSGYAKIVTLTQAQYDALAVKDSETIYNISDAQ